LRDAANQPFLWDALRLDHLQIVSTDHCPFNDEQKRLGLGDFSKIPNGLAAIQHRLPMLWEHGVRAGRLSPNRVVEITSTAVAKMFGLHPRKGLIAPGADADIVVFDPARRHVFSTATSLMNVDYDIYEGREVAGSPRLTMSRGTVVFDDGRIVTRPGHGRFVRRDPFDATIV
jgi:dihydropyrimidinase